jgi:hypothetical protein
VEDSKHSRSHRIPNTNGKTTAAANKKLLDFYPLTTPMRATTDIRKTTRVVPIWLF